ncbi:peptidylprolyl isomerase [Aquipseudomonas alcaligenes]
MAERLEHAIELGAGRRPGGQVEVGSVLAGQDFQHLGEVHRTRFHLGGVNKVGQLCPADQPEKWRHSDGATNAGTIALSQNEDPVMPKAMARHILVKTEAEAAALKKRIAAGEAFDVLAKKYSTCPSGKKGGDLGEVRPGQMVRAVDQVIFKKPLREVHGPVKTQFGYHLIQVFYRE